MRTILAYLSVLFVLVSLHSCFDDPISTDPAIRLRFSVDTLRFDTVFTQLGSATRILKVYNDFDEAVEISNIQLDNQNSKFRLNVDGIPGDQHSNIQIFANDSLYIFAEVTIDPDDPLSISPFIIEEFVSFQTNGNQQKVLLEAWGQNANYIPNRFNKGNPFLLSCDLGNVVWDDPKPYVIYGIMLIDSCNLILPENTNVYVHGGVVNNDLGIFNDGLILVLKDGSIQARGTAQNPVVIQGDRLESGFQEVKGQWAGLRFLTDSRNNLLEHCIIKNSIVGVRADSLSELNIESSQFLNTSNVGLIGIHADISATNSLFADNGSFAAALTFGGTYRFDYCTFASYGNQDEAIRLDNFQCVDPLCLDLPLINPIDAEFRNCIFAGSSSDEISLSDATQGMVDGAFNYRFENCLVEVDELLDVENFPNFFDNCIDCFEAMPGDTLFIDSNESNFRLDTGSIAEMKAIPINGIFMDIEDNSRDASSPDIGCYEFQE